MHAHTKDDSKKCEYAQCSHLCSFIPRLLESDISMALSGVSMAIPCTEMKRGGPARHRDKFTSQAGR